MTIIGTLIHIGIFVMNNLISQLKSMYSKNGYGLGMTILSFVLGFITTIVAMFSQVEDNGPSSSTMPRVTVQEAPLRTQIMAEDPDISQEDLINTITNRPTNPHHARASVVRMPDGRVVVVSSNPVGGSHSSDSRTHNLPPQGGSGHG